MVEGTGFENRQGRKFLGGSNPPLSATEVRTGHVPVRTAVGKGGDEKGAGTTVPSRGRGNFQQKIIRDRIPPFPQRSYEPNHIRRI